MAARPGMRLRPRLRTTLFLALGLALPGLALAQPHREPNPKAAAKTAEAKQLLGAGRVAEAVVGFEAAVALDSLSSQAAENLGIAYLTAHRAADSYAAFRRATVLDPQSPSAWNRAGQVLLSNLGRSEGALAAFRQALALDPDFGPAQFSMGVYHLYRGELGEAQKAMSQARSSAQDEFEERFYFGASLLLLVSRGELASASHGLRGQVNEFPSDVRAAQAYALVLRLTGRPNEALDALDALRRRLLPQAVLWNERGLIFEAMAKPDSAILSFNTAWDLDTTSAEAAFHLARLHFALGDTTRALGWLTRVEERDPGSYATALLAARLHAARGQREWAQRAYDRARRLHPSTFATLDGGLSAPPADSLLLKAEREIVAGDLMVAANRASAASMDPTTRARSLVLAAWANRSSPNAPAAAVVQLEAALEAEPPLDRATRAEAERELGRAHLRIGNREDARVHLEKSLAIVGPKEADAAPALASLLVLYLDKGDRSAAAKWAKKAGATDDPDLLAALARVADATGDAKGATAYRDRARSVALLP